MWNTVNLTFGCEVFSLLHCNRGLIQGCISEIWWIEYNNIIGVLVISNLIPYMTGIASWQQ